MFYKSFNVSPLVKLNLGIAILRDNEVAKNMKKAFIFFSLLMSLSS